MLDARVRVRVARGLDWERSSFLSSDPSWNTIGRLQSGWGTIMINLSIKKGSVITGVIKPRQWFYNTREPVANRMWSLYGQNPPKCGHWRLRTVYRLRPLCYVRGAVLWQLSGVWLRTASKQVNFKVRATISFFKVETTSTLVICSQIYLWTVSVHYNSYL